jgi:hypothetical protein
MMPGIISFETRSPLKIRSTSVSFLIIQMLLRNAPDVEQGKHPISRVESQSDDNRRPIILFFRRNSLSFAGSASEALVRFLTGSALALFHDGWIIFAVLRLR